MSRRQKYAEQLFAAVKRWFAGDQATAGPVSGHDVTERRVSFVDSGGRASAPRLPHLEWVDARAETTVAYDRAFVKAKSGELLEFVVLDGEGEDRGKLMSEIIGQGIDSTTGLPLVYVSPLASEEKEIMPWAMAALTAPSSIHLARMPLAHNFFHRSNEFVQIVERWRLRKRTDLPEPWCSALARGRVLLQATGRTAPVDEAPAEARQADGGQDHFGAGGQGRGSGRRDPVMEAVAELDRNIRGTRGPSVSPPERAGAPGPGSQLSSGSFRQRRGRTTAPGRGGRWPGPR